MPSVNGSEMLSLPIVLTGLPGAGKSRVGERLAARLGVPHVDTDILVERMAGVDIPTIFRQQGESEFRRLECDAVADALTMNAVVSLGGGAISSQAVRQMLRGASVVYIDVDHEELLRRTADHTHRPLLRDDPDGALRRLRTQREPWYVEVARVAIHSDSRPVEHVVEQIMAMIDSPSSDRRITVSGPRPYDVVIGSSIDIAAITSSLSEDASKVLLIHAGPVTDQAQAIAQGLRQRGFDTRCVVVPDAEDAKTYDVAIRLWGETGDFRLGRADAIVALGGGATTDVAGFIAATWLRGIDVVQIPTTLLAMVDAAIGGKTGINTPVGKNLVGAFHTPARVICASDSLATLPSADLRAGFGEVIKCGFIADEEILTRIEETPVEEVLNPSSQVQEELIARSVAVKARVVGEDLTESGLREILNYGHTLGHAIEKHEQFRWRHGEAVAVGCVFAAHLAHSLGLIDMTLVLRHERLFSLLGLPIRYTNASLGQLITIMLSDKKVRRGDLRFVLLDGLCRPFSRVVTPQELIGAGEAMGMDVTDVPAM
ncbi:3-dehydroquinate synthase [Schaalia sp. ZJ1691]|uniref:3-dehydroquinate synthase n=1 Tax=Schaalia sp. ZJ1691 TaxID=2709404 RepID=UPI00197F7177|nr:3-dehydroquinate synthase [Schaalia sp. ZJ1691]